MDGRSSLGQTWMTVLLIASRRFTSRSNKTSDPSMQELLCALTGPGCCGGSARIPSRLLRSLRDSPLVGTTVHDGLIGGWRRGWDYTQRNLLLGRAGMRFFDTAT